jgi:hypothetical protein
VAISLRHSFELKVQIYWMFVHVLETLDTLIKEVLLCFQQIVSEKSFKYDTVLNTMDGNYSSELGKQ